MRASMVSSNFCEKWPRGWIVLVRPRALPSRFGKHMAMQWPSALAAKPRLDSTELGPDPGILATANAFTEVPLVQPCHLHRRQRGTFWGDSTNLMANRADVSPGGLTPQAKASWMLRGVPGRNQRVCGHEAMSKSGTDNMTGGHENTKARGPQAFRGPTQNRSCAS